MFAGKFATGAGTRDGEAGKLGAHLIERAALTLAPGGAGPLAEALPVARVGELASGGGRRGIRGQRQYLIARNRHPDLPSPSTETRLRCSGRCGRIPREYRRSG